ncbi:MAG TPA: glutamine synthetase [Gammaproteobacteria bacterium]|nr:glutamine synthetase [Gammaproteobacteria bacterium]
MAEADNLITTYEQSGIKRVKLAFVDVDGVLRGKYISLSKFKSIAAGSSGFCDCVLGWDVDDQLYDNASFTGWHTAFPDAPYRIDLTTERRLRDENDIPFFLVEFIGETTGHPICPRSRLKQVLLLAEEMGYEPRLAFEYEFFIFRESAQSVRDKNFQGLIPLTPGNFGYSVLRTLSESDLFNDFMDYCIDHGLDIEGLHCETGPGVWEAAIGVDGALAAADKAALFKTFAKAFFQRRELIATFMAKWSMDYPGQSGHLHQSLNAIDTSKNIFFDESDPQNMSDTMRFYVGGLQKHMKSFLAMTSPTVNSYTRLVRGAWAPTAATWGVENRTAALRVIKGDTKSQRVEFRVGSADANPYLTAAANIAAGLDGINNKIEPEAPVEGNAYDLQDDLPDRLQLSSNLRDANYAFNRSAVARQYLGDSFVDHFSASRDWEVREYERSVNDWQLKRYFEII